eukprot:759021-Hanusia_phi.AAC.2
MICRLRSLPCAMLSDLLLQKLQVLLTAGGKSEPYIWLQETLTPEQPTTTFWSLLGDADRSYYIHYPCDLGAVATPLGYRNQTCHTYNSPTISSWTVPEEN